MLIVLSTRGVTAQFKITADKDPGSAPITVNYVPTNTIGNYLEESNDQDGNSRMSGVSRSVDVLFEQTPGQNEWTGTFDVAMRNIDNIDAAHGMVTVVLDPITGPVTSATYTTALAPDNTAKTVIIHDQDTPIISITPAPNIVSSQNAEFTINADIEPWQPLAIRFTPNETGSNYLDSRLMAALEPFELLILKISFSRAGAGPMATGILSIPTVSDSNVTSGSISIQLIDDPNPTLKNYELTNAIADRTASVQISDAPTPELSITDSSLEVNEGASATIVVTADPNPIVPSNNRIILPPRLEVIFSVHSVVQLVNHGQQP